MTETPGGGRSWDDGPEQTPDQQPSWAEPEPESSGADQYDEWLAAEDQLLEEDQAQAETQHEGASLGDEAADEEPAPPVAEAPAEAVGTDPQTASEAVSLSEPGSEPDDEAAAPEAADSVDEHLGGSPETAAPGVPVGEELPEQPVPVEEEPLVEPAEPATPDPSPAVAAAPLVDPVTADTGVETEVVPDEDPEEGLDEPALAADADAEVPAFRSATAVLASLAAAVVVLLALTAFLAVRSVDTRDGGSDEDSRRDALAASRTAARLVFSYDYRHLGKDFQAGKAVTTGEFRDQYVRTTGKLVDDTAAKYKAVVVADISEAAVVRVSKGSVVTLVFLNQQSTSTLNSGSKITQSRLEMTMVHKNGRWLVQKIRAF